MQDSHPLVFQAITVDSRPDYRKMIALLQSQGFVIQSSISGKLAYDSILQNADAIEHALANPVEATEVMQEEEEVEVEEVQETPAPPPTPIPLEEWQCDSTPLAEAEERLRYCVETSFKTGSGLIMLENDLSIILENWPEDTRAWMAEMQETWSNRLHSKVLADFLEALELWVTAQESVRSSA